jgi:hypothetical protein
VSHWPSDQDRRPHPPAMAPTTISGSTPLATA